LPPTNVYDLVSRFITEHLIRLRADNEHVNLGNGSPDLAHSPCLGPASEGYVRVLPPIKNWRCPLILSRGRLPAAYERAPPPGGAARAEEARARRLGSRERPRLLFAGLGSTRRSVPAVRLGVKATGARGQSTRRVGRRPDRSSPRRLVSSPPGGRVCLLHERNAPRPRLGRFTSQHQLQLLALPRCSPCR
jgi:hypothetical protein